MQFQFDIASSCVNTPKPQPTTDSVPELLKYLLEQQHNQLNQIVELQKEHLNYVRTQAQDAQTRWRNLLARWQQEHPEFAESCKKAYPSMEKAYVQLLVNMVEEVAQQEDSLDTDFTIQEFLDRYGMRVGQLSHLLSIVGPLSEAAHQNEANKQA
jgi:transketolase